jgi:hypothetical protein
MTYQAWICESCLAMHQTRASMWNCPSCEKEVCDTCFETYGHCKPCAKGKADEELRLAANATGAFDFEPLEGSDV